jgi:hypothetical protein
MMGERVLEGGAMAQGGFVGGWLGIRVAVGIE